MAAIFQGVIHKLLKVVDNPMVKVDRDVDSKNFLVDLNTVDIVFIGIVCVWEMVEI